MTISGLIILLFVFTCSLMLIHNKLTLIKKTKEITKSYLCTKKYTGEFNRHYRKIQHINQALFLLNTTKKTGLFLPYIGIVVAQNAHNAEKALILLQNSIHISYMKYIYKLFKEGCSFTPNIFKTSFIHNGFTLKRDQFNRARIRKEEWKVYYISIELRLKIIHRHNKSLVYETI